MLHCRCMCVHMVMPFTHAQLSPIPLRLVCTCNCCMYCARYGDPKKMDAGSPDQAFATLFRDQCSVKFLEAHAAVLGRYAEVPSHTVSIASLAPSMFPT